MSREIVLPIRCSTYKQLMNIFVETMIAEIIIIGFVFWWMWSEKYQYMVCGLSHLPSIPGLLAAWVILTCLVFSECFLLVVGIIVAFKLVELLPTFKCIQDEDEKEVER